VNDRGRAAQLPLRFGSEIRDDLSQHIAPATSPRATTVGFNALPLLTLLRCFLAPSSVAGRTADEFNADSTVPADELTPASISCSRGGCIMALRCGKTSPNGSRDLASLYPDLAKMQILMLY
jgi:hypothetical protein